MGLFDPSPEKLAIVVVAVGAAGAFVWLVVRTAAGSAIRSADRRRESDRRWREVRDWERSQRQR